MSHQDEIAQQLKLLGIHRSTLAHYLNQRGILGEAFAPPVVAHGINEARTQIRRIKAALRSWGVAVEDQLNDEEQPSEKTPPAEQTNAPSTTRPRRPSKPRNKAAGDDLPYDVYISYHPADKAWVRNTLLPQLEGAGLRVIVDYRDFAIGVPKLVNIERAVDQSQHTLIVMTPEWVDGEWQDFQGLLAQTSDPAGRRAKLLPLMLRSCMPPSRIAMLDYADFTDPAERDDQMQRLLRSLAGQPARTTGSKAPKAAPVQGGTATVDQRSPEQIDVTALRQLLTLHFNTGELQNLCFDLNIDYENLPGQGKGDKARELIAYAQRHGRLASVISQARRLRPNADWQSVAQTLASNPAKSASSGTEQAARAAGNTAVEQQADFVIITALEEEREAMLSKLPGHQRLNPSTADIRTYYLASVPAMLADGAAIDYRVAVTSLLGMGRVQAVVATGDAIRRWRPRYVLLVGIAGGVAMKGVRLGDVLVSDQIVDYELQKLTAKGPQVRWQVHRADPRLLNAALNFSDTGWHKQVGTWRPDPDAPKRHVGPIASGDKVIAFDKVLTKYRDTWPALIGVEMEAAGAATATFQAAEQPGFFMIRGVSDFADEQKGTPDVDRWRAYACDVAAAYTIAFLQSGPIASSYPR
jgi:nucleoside phosphorylase